MVFSFFAVRSRVLLSLECEEDETYGPHAPFSYQDLFSRWFSYRPLAKEESVEDNDFTMTPPLPKVTMLDVESENNQTGDEKMAPSHEPQTMKADIAAEVPNMGKHALDMTTE